MTLRRPRDRRPIVDAALMIRSRIVRRSVLADIRRRSRLTLMIATAGSVARSAWQPSRLGAALDSRPCDFGQLRLYRWVRGAAASFDGPVLFFRHVEVRSPSFCIVRRIADKFAASFSGLEVAVGGEGPRFPR